MAISEAYPLTDRTNFFFDVILDAPSLRLPSSKQAMAETPSPRSQPQANHRLRSFCGGRIQPLGASFLELLNGVSVIRIPLRTWPFNKLIGH